MKKFGPKGMKVMKTVHLLLIMMWTVGVMGIVTLMSGPFSSNEETAVTLADALKLDYYLVIPGALLCVAMGIVYGIFTNWGFFKYRWLTVKWIASIAIILAGSLIFHPLCVEALELAESDTPGNTAEISRMIVECQVINWIQVVAQIMLVAISVFKPWKRKVNVIRKAV
ncbi:MAG: hypothetical protein K1V84_09740 [Muribaculaceae bacterium]